MGDIQQALLNLVNASGFLLQLRVEHEIEETKAGHGWDILGREHLWEDPESDEEHFIDLILSSGILRTIIECKRVLEGDWVFLAPTPKEKQTHQARLFWSFSADIEKGNHPFDWSDFWLRGIFAESTFCVVRGQGEKDKPMLERLAGTVVKSVEALSLQEFKLLRQAKQESPRVYIPVVVTTAQLHVCHFDPCEVSIQDGQLPMDKLSDNRFEPVPYIIFQKSLGTGAPAEIKGTDLGEMNRAGERSVFIVHASEISRFLKEIYALEYQGKWPWIQAGFG